MTKLNRKAGYIADPRMSTELLERLQKSVDHFERDDLIKILQVCSLSINRNKIESGCTLSSELVTIRDRLVGSIIDRIQSRIEDIPTTSISVAMSSVARMYNPSMKPFMDEMSQILAERVSRTLSLPPESAKAYIQRSDLHRAIPFVFLAYNQNSVEFPTRLVDVSIPLFVEFRIEIPYKHLSQYMLMMRRDEGMGLLADYAIERIQAAPDDMTVMDLCRFAQSVDRVPMIIDIIARKNNPRDWDIHGLLELSRILKCSDTINKKIWNKYSRKIFDLKNSIPPDYLAEIYRNLNHRLLDAVTGDNEERKGIIQTIETILNVIVTRKLKTQSIVDAVSRSVSDITNLSAYKQFINSS
jgi:hypothetical protein